MQVCKRPFSSSKHILMPKGGKFKHTLIHWTTIVHAATHQGVCEQSEHTPCTYNYRICTVLLIRSMHVVLCFVSLNTPWCNTVHSAQRVFHLGASLPSVYCKPLNNNVPLSIPPLWEQCFHFSRKIIPERERERGGGGEDIEMTNFQCIREKGQTTSRYTKLTFLQWVFHFP